ncbi:unnamed protein product [Bursaphelenchus okinawaensis]|uniref:Protein kinase domain-containing protein n=1 Tax=Bursaphelenchus okinawaensis TaxID=465554 RepID=A0A811JQN2_9BILA|nr:unnamed protein product [Bursaphelenchus okinawaensis]CAG9078754.1 unnamed protein product [Bursaphelenchus okinawaensis]
MSRFGQLMKRFQFREVEDALGSGNFGTVYRAFDTHMKKLVALKILGKGKKMEANYKHEHKILQQLVHPFIIHLYCVLDMPTHMVMVLELAWGGGLSCELRERLAKLKAFRSQKRDSEELDEIYIDFERISKYFVQMLSAVTYVHSQGFIHRDIKPQNMMFIDRSKRFLKLGDFGTCCRQSDTKATKVLVGTPAYMAPDGFNGYVTQSFDCWSLGIVLYEMIELKVPFEQIDHVFYWRDHSLDISFKQNRSNIPTDLKNLLPKMICESENRMDLTHIYQLPFLQPHIQRLYLTTV